MLDEREYMRPGRSGDGWGMKCLFGLIAANVLAYLVISGDIRLGNALALNVDALKQFEIWRVLTAVFMHAGFTHLLLNMFGLFVFGQLSAPILGGKRFLWLFVVSGVLGNLLWFVFNMGNGYASVVGASGAVMGVIMATAMMVPNIRMFILIIPFPIKLKTLAVVYIIIEVVSQLTSDQSSPVAYLAHIGGFIGGYLFMRFFVSREIMWDPLERLFGRTVSIASQNTEKTPEPEDIPHGWKVSNYDPRKGAPVPREEIDRLLDKLSRTGINSLTDAEQDTLRRAREEMMNRR